MAANMDSSHPGRRGPKTQNRGLNRVTREIHNKEQLGGISTRLGRTVGSVDELDAESRYREEEADNKVRPKLGESSGSSIDGEKTIVAWEESDPEDPYNWSSTKKGFILVLTMMTIINSTLGSSLPSGAVSFMAEEFGVESEQQLVLPISVYLVGYVFGPLVWAPMSEQFGRRLLFVSTFVVFTLFTMACALAPDWSAMLAFRLFTGIFASAPISIVTGILADIYRDPRTRGRAMSAFMAATFFGPLLAPIISGFASTSIGWRWSFWIGLMYAGATLVPLAIMPETYGPVLLLRRANKIRRADPRAQVVAPHELERKNLRELATIVLTRPLRMLVFELIVNTTCVYLSLVYTIFYMSFQAFPLIFQRLYGLSPGDCGLAYLPMGLGAVLALPIFFAYDTFHLHAQARDAPWARKEEYRRVPLACLGGPAFVVALFWLGFTARDGIPFVVPMLAGVPFGMGFMLIFIALLNYLTDAYEIFAASANAAAGCSRALLATVLPLATAPLFARLGIAGACALLGGLSALTCAVPFVFLWKGERIRAGSRFCRALREGREELERKVEEQRRRAREKVVVDSGGIVQPGQNKEEDV